MTSRVPGIEVARGEQILGTLAVERLIQPKHVRPAPLATPRELALVHSESYLDETARPTALGRIFGLEAPEVEVDPILIAQRRQVGGTVEAARWVIQGAGRTGFNFGGGFHHAEPEQGSGFCVYNDVAIAIASLRRHGYDRPILVIDLDYHQGNGNIVTFENDPSVRTYSVHGSVWTHVEAADDEQHLLPSGTGDAEYLAKLEQTLPRCFEAHDPALTFYIAGNDVLEGDRLGDFTLSRKGVLARDRFVVECARERQCAVVVTLAGGYSKDAWRASTDFARWLLTDDARISAEPRPSLREHYARIAAQLEPHELQQSGSSWEITAADLMGDLAAPRYGSSRILDYYSKHGLEFALERYGLLAKVRERGFVQPRVTIDPADRERQHGTLHATKNGREHLLVDVVVARTSMPAPESLLPGDDLELISIEWMMLQNPTESFSLRNPPWPGQDHPGLGVGEEAMLLILQGAKRLGLDGVVNHPSRYHIAFIGGDEFLFLDPATQGRFDALRTALRSLDLTEAAWMMERQEVRWADDDTPVEWLPEDSVFPVSARLRTYFGSESYEEPRARSRARTEARGISLKPGAPAPPA